MLEIHHYRSDQETLTLQIAASRMYTLCEQIIGVGCQELYRVKTPDEDRCLRLQGDTLSAGQYYSVPNETSYWFSTSAVPLTAEISNCQLQSRSDNMTLNMLLSN